MKKSICLGLLSLLLTTLSFAKKDPEAWKKEKTLEKQYSVLKENASYWDGYFMFKEPRLNEFHNSILDTIKTLETKVSANNTEIKALNDKINALTTRLTETQSKLDESLTKENDLTTLGIDFDKQTFPTVVYTIIVILIVVAIVAFFLFFRSNTTTRETEKRYQDLSEELKEQRKRALDRETKLHRELQTERNKNH